MRVLLGDGDVAILPVEPIEPTSRLRVPRLPSWEVYGVVVPGRNEFLLLLAPFAEGRLGILEVSAVRSLDATPESSLVPCERRVVGDERSSIASAHVAAAKAGAEGGRRQ